MQLKKIQYFIKIVEQGSLSKAAEDLYLTQPTLSRFLAKLEEEAGTELFTRAKNNALTLTECGRMYYETALKINTLWKGLEVDIDTYKHRNKTSDIVNIGIADDDLLNYVSGCIDVLSEVHPEVSFHLFCTGVSELYQRIRDGTLDIATSPFLTMDPDFTSAVFRRSEVDLVVAWENPLSRFSYQLPGQEGLRLSIHTLDKKTPFALIREPAILRQEENRYLQKMRVNPIVQRTYIVHESISEVLQQDKKLVGFCPRHLRTDKMAYIALDPPFFYKSAVYYHKDKALTPVEKKMITMLKNQPQTREI